MWSSAAFSESQRFRFSELVATETELKAIVPPAIIGFEGAFTILAAHAVHGMPDIFMVPCVTSESPLLLNRLGPDCRQLIRSSLLRLRKCNSVPHF